MEKAIGAEQKGVWVREREILASPSAVLSTDVVDVRILDYTLSDCNQYVVSSLVPDYPAMSILLIIYFNFPLSSSAAFSAT